MADTSSVFSKGSGGSSFEHHVQAAFLATLITKGSVPCIPEAEITELALQATRLGYATDDLVVQTQTPRGVTHRLLIQAKYNITISANDSTFQEVMDAFWRDYNNSTLFDQSLDKLVIVKSGLNDTERNHVKVLLNWAKHKATSQDFYLEVNRIGAKKERLKVFADVLAKINGGKALSDDEIWRFLRCVELLDYDFLNTGSVDKANVISLLGLAKSETATSDALGIWRELLDIASSYNPDGGSITSASVKLLPVYQQFSLQKLEPAHQALRKLYSNGHAILLPMKNTVAGYQLPREDLKNRITESCNEDQLTIVAGAAGVGKSAVVRDWITEQRSGDATFVFRADQFNEPHLSHVFAKQGVSIELSELFAYLALLPEKTIVVDSAEKLLEGDPGNAFRQLLAYLESAAGTNVRIVLTCRRYAIDLIVHKFGISKTNIIDVPLLTDEELGQFAAVAPSLRSLLANPNLKSLLKSLKYLDLSVSLTDRTTEDLSGVTLSGFKEKLWQHLVENVTVRDQGMPLKRKRAFLGVAIQRAQHMSLFIEPIGVSEDAVFALENDGIIFSEEGNDGYAPTHDVLEDLALVKFIHDHWKTHRNAEQFFTAVGSEPAMRRAFRLWVEDQLAEEAQDVFQLITQAQASQTIANYWLDEMLIAVFRSPDSEIFFKAFQDLLLQNDATFLCRCIHLIRTACRQSSSWSTGGRSINPNPIGSGWRYALQFISEYFTVLQQARILIANLIIEWASNINGIWRDLPAEAEPVKDMLLVWVAEMEKADNSWDSRSEESVVQQLLIVLFKVVQLAPTEVSELLQRASSPKTRDRDYRVSGFYDRVVEVCLSGLYSAPLCKHLPNAVIQVANNTWKLKPKGKKELYGHSLSSRLSREEEFGLEAHLRHTFPAGVFKSPILSLLRFSTVKGLQFVVELANYCAACYQKAQRDSDESLEKFALTANDSSKIHQFGNDTLWAAHRGTIVTSNILHTVLMSTEQFLLERCQMQTDTSRTLVQQYFRFLIENSSSALLTGMLAGIAQAYPDELGAEWLPLLTAKQCFKWDLHRRLGEHSVLSPADMHLPFAQEVTYKFNHLPHRNAHSRGLVDFVISYQMTGGEYREQIRGIIATHYAELDENDYVWHKMLNELDISKWEMEPVPDEPNKFLVQPTYDEKVKAGLEAYNIEAAPERKVLAHSEWVRKIFEDKSIPSDEYEQWVTAYEEFNQPGYTNHYLQRPAGLAIIGLRHFAEQLTDAQREWAITVLAINIEYKIISARSYYETTDFPGKSSVLDTGLYLQSFSLLFKHLTEEADTQELILFTIRTIVSHISNHELEHVFKHLREGVALEHPTQYKTIWKGVVAYARFAKEKEYTYDASDPESFAQFQTVEREFLNTLLTNPDGVAIDLAGLDFTNNSTWILPKALAIIPYDTADDEQIRFMQVLCSLMMLGVQKEEEDDDVPRYRRSMRGDPTMNYENTMWVWQYFSHSLILNRFSVSSSILDILVTNAVGYAPTRYNSGQSPSEIVGNVLEYTILNLDKLVYNSSDTGLKTSATDTFWQLWNFLLKRLTDLGTARFSKFVLLDTHWNFEATSWLPLNSAGDFYERAVNQFGRVNLKSVINALATIGDQTLLPRALGWVVRILQTEPDMHTPLLQPMATQLIERLYQQHIIRIKANRQLHQDFIWLLDKMVDAGVSIAYLIRENVITYKLKSE
ncbi:hypothetical protein GCM10028822_07890 [Hymenobacter terrigena]